MFYKNCSSATMTFHGVTLKPGEVKEVPGYINHEKFIAVKEPLKPKQVKKPQESTDSKNTKEG